MNIFAEIWLFFKRRVLEEVRQPVWIFMGLATPLMYIILFAPLLQNVGYPPKTDVEVLDTFVPAVLTLLAFGTGMGSGWGIIWDLQSGLVERFRVTPARRFSMLMGMVLSDILAFIIPALIVIGIAAGIGMHVDLAGFALMLALLCLLTATVSAWSISLGLILKQVSSLASVVTGLQLPLTLLSGVLLPLSMGPVWLQNIAHINPMYYTVEASRTLSSGMIDSAETITAFAVMIPLTALVLAWATRVYRKAVA